MSIYSPFYLGSLLFLAVKIEYSIARWITHYVYYLRIVRHLY
jgi:hypothetical protein